MDTLSQLESLSFKFASPQTLIELELCAKVVKNSYAFGNDFQNENLYSKDQNEENELYEYILDIIQNSVNYYDVKCKKYILLHHVQQVFHKDDKVHKRALNNVISEPAKQIVSVTVHGAYLISKKHKDFTDPFCVLYLDSSKNKWYSTSVKSDTTSPVWDETFEFNASLQSYDCLCVQMWYHKNRRSTGVMTFGTMRNPLNFYKKQGHKFLGFCNIPLKALVLNDEVQTFRLMKQDTTESVGVVNLKFRLKSISEESIHKHEQLLQKLLLHEVKQPNTILWNGKWCFAAEMIIKHHILNQELDTIWDRLLKWVVFVRVHQKQPITFNAFYNLLVELVKINETHTNFLIETDQFWDSTRVLLHSCFSFIQKLRDLNFGGEIYEFAAAQAKAIMGIFSLLSSIKNTENIEMVSEETKKLCTTNYGAEEIQRDQILNLRQVLELTLVQQAEKRLSHLESTNLDNVNETVEQDMIYYCKIIDQLDQDILFAAKIIKRFLPIFEFSHMEQIYVLYADQFTKLYKIPITTYSNGINSYKPIYKKSFVDHFFYLYFDIKKFVNLGEKYCQSKLTGLEITNFHSWFRNSLHYLFDHCRGECLNEIEHVMSTHNLQDFSTFTGTNHIELLQKEKNSMIRRWIDLSWPEFETYFNLLMNVNQYLFEYYESYVHHLIKKYNVPKTKKSMGYEGSCIVIGNIDYIIKSAKDTSKCYFLRIQNSKIMKESIEQKEKLKMYEKECDSLIESKIQHLQSVLDLFIRNLVLESQTEIKRYVADIDKVIIDDYSVALRECKIFVFKLLSQPLGLVSESVYEKIKYEFKVLTLNTLYETIRKKKKVTPLYLYNMNEVLKKVLICLEIDNNEYNNEELDNLQRNMFLHIAPSDDLIENYLIDRYEKQKQLVYSSYGTIQIQIFRTDGNIVVKIFKCEPNEEKIKEAEQKGKIKLNVKVKFSTSSKSAKELEKYKTDCGSSFPQEVIIPENVFVEHRWITFEVYIKHKVTNAFLAEAIYSTENVNSGEISTLQLTKPKCTEIYKILEQRKDDKVSSFVADIKCKSED